jgi:tetratricopeptide (TPR) repeat protein
MALFTTITAVLAAKCTLSYLTECIIDHSSGIALQSIPKLGERLKKQFADTQPEVNGHLQKAILSSHWMATLVFVEQMRKKRLLDDAYKSLHRTVKEELKKLQDKDYHPDEISPDAYDTAKLIKLPKEEEVIRELRASVMQFHLEQLDKKTGNIKNLADYRRLTVFIQDGWAEEKLDWYALMTAFLNQLLKGDNNNAKDSFQNQTLAEIKLKLEDFEKYAGTCVQGIGEERFRGFEETLFTEIAGMKESLVDIRKKQEETFNVVEQVRTGVLEIQNQLGQTRQLNLNVFEHYSSLQAEIDLLKMEIDELEQEKKETLEFIREEENERKRLRFEKDYASFEAEQLQKRYTIEEKQKELDTFRENIQRTWLSISTDSSPRLIQAREALELGNLNQADKILDKDVLLNEVGRSLQDNESLAQEFIAKANLILTQKSSPDWFELCDQYYAQAVRLHPSYNSQMAYGHFLISHNQHERGQKEYKEALKYASNNSEKATALNNLGHDHTKRKEFDEAEKKYVEALIIRRKLAEENPQIYLSDVAITLNNLGAFYNDKNDYDKAEESYSEALEIYRKLVITNPQTYLQDVALTLNNLGVLQQAELENDKAEENYTEALKIYRRLEASNPQKYLPKIALPLSNLGTLQNNKKEYDKAEESSVEALAIYRKLAEFNPQKYLPDVAHTLMNRGVLQHDKKEYDKAQESNTEALEIYSKLSASNPQIYLQYVALTLQNTGALHADKNEFSKAEESYSEALKIRRKLTESNPQAYLPSLAITLGSMGWFLHHDKNDYKKSEECYIEALEIRRKLAEVSPQTYLPDVAKTLNNLGVLQRDKNELGKAEESYTEALEIRRKLVVSNPQRYLEYVADTLKNLGDLQRDKNELEKAKNSYTEAMEIFKKLMESSS